MCGAPSQGQGLEGVDLSTETVIQGEVTRDGSPVPAAYVRLLDASGEFTAEVQSSAQGHFRFFAAPGSWTLRVLSAGGRGEHSLVANRGLNEAQLQLDG
ncbi:MAG: DUF1416 domain-containing protein [Geodermatophilaceae bacterium]|nr:DUF1416 domain-containing protein [Geodermatophilaceae bacterium]MDQ3464663.1 DUF1416 domain-containing protein [Actinomycetota bacterium]